MTLDTGILAALGLFAAIGFYSGAIQQFSHWIGLVVAYMCSKPIAVLVAPVVAERMGWPPALTAVGLSAAAMPVIFLAATVLSRGILNAIIPGDQRNMPDRIAGIFLGAGKIAVIAWVVLSGVLAIENTPVVPAGVKTALSSSSAAKFTRDHGLFADASPSALDKLKSLAAMREDPEQARALLKDPALKAFFNDSAVKKALKNGDASSLLDHPQLKAILADPELAKKIAALNAR